MIDMCRLPHVQSHHLKVVHFSEMPVALIALNACHALPLNQSTSGPIGGFYTLALRLKSGSELFKGTSSTTA